MSDEFKSLVGQLLQYALSNLLPKDREEIIGRTGIESIPARKQLVRVLADSTQFSVMVGYLRRTTPFDGYYPDVDCQWIVASIVDIILDGCRPVTKGGWKSNVDPRLLSRSIERNFAAISAELARPYWPFQLISPIYGLSSKDPIQLGPPFSCTVQRLTKQELSALFEPTSLVSPQMSRAEMKQIEGLFSILIDVHIPKPHDPLEPVSLTEPKLAVERVVELMSLYKEGDIQGQGVYLVPKSVFLPKVALGFQLQEPIPMDKDFTLELSDVARIEEFAANVQKLMLESQKSKKTRYLDVSIRYFASSRQKRDLSDRLVDLMTAFEALMSEDRGEITFTLSSRVATLSSSSMTERAQIFRDFKKLYSKRSKIVHGDANEPEVTREEILKLEEFYRSCTKKIFAKGQIKTKDEFISELDDLLLNPSFHDA